jgi:CRISPR-associated endoribonuclease Cas6
MNNSSSNIYLNLDELEKYFDTVKSYNHKHNIKYRDLAIIKLIYHCGLTTSEVVNLNREDIKDNKIYLNRNGKSRTIDIESIMKDIENYLLLERKRMRPSSYNATEALFLSVQGNRISKDAVRNLVKKYAIKMGIKNADQVTPIALNNMPIIENDNTNKDTKNNKKKYISGIFTFFMDKTTKFNYFPSKHFLGVFYNALAYTDLWEGELLHDRGGEKPFTISPIFPYIKKNRNGKYILKKGQKYSVRISFLTEELYNLFKKSIKNAKDILRLNNTLLRNVNFKIDLSHKWCRTSTSDVLNDRSKSKEHIGVQFHTITAFKDGNHNIMLPIPKYVFSDLLGKWNMYGGFDLSLDISDIEKIHMSRFDNLSSFSEQFKDYFEKGFRGYCEFYLGNLSKKKQKEVDLLIDFGEFSGVGIKTTMGFGQISKKGE